MFVLFEFLICDIFVCANAIIILVSRCLTQFSVSMIKFFYA